MRFYVKKYFFLPAIRAIPANKWEAADFTDYPIRCQMKM